MLNHGVLAFEITIGSDTGKIFLLSLSAIAVYALARWGSSRSGQSENILTAESQSVSPVSSSKVSTSDPDDVLALFPADPNLGRIRITKFFFKKLDAISGPPDPLVFADELNVQLYDPDSGQKWGQSYVVASPRGLSQILRDKSWKYLYAPQMIVLPKYDLEEIRRAVVSRIMEENELFKPSGEKEESL